MQQSEVHGMAWRPRTSRRAALTAALGLVAGTLVAVAAPAVAHQPPKPGPVNTLPSAVPAKNTPSVDNGETDSIAQNGNTMIIGGTFTSVNSQTRNHVAAFDRTTGALSTSFAPNVNGNVNSVLPGPTANTVYIGGAFTQVNGQAAQFVAELDLTTGNLVSTFKPPTFNFGYINDLVVRGNRLYLAGTFTKVGGKAHGGLASLNATTGALDPFMNIQLTGHHNDSGSGAQGWIGPWDFDVTPDGATMVAIGDFKYANGLLRDQVVMIDLTGATAAIDPWATSRYSPYCFNWAFDAYVRGVSFSPDGSYFVVNATGGGNKNTLCDATSRFETQPTNTDAQPTWVDETGGDTVWAVQVTNTAVYIGGHNRWNNNPNGADHALPGAVPRPGVAALDPVSGRPFAWNPGRNPLGKAVFSILATDDGLWYGSDTIWVGNYKYKRPRIAFFPYAGGYSPASTSTTSLPATAWLGSPSGSNNNLTSVNFDGTTASASSANSQGIDFSNWHGAFMVGNQVFYGYSDGFLYSRTFDGTTFGPAVKIDPYDDPAWDNVDSHDGTTFQGAVPTLYSKMTKVTGMFFNGGKMYYTLAGDPNLYSKWFSPDSGIMDERTFTSTSSVNFANADGMFVDGGFLYYASTDGFLRKVAFTNGVVSGAPVAVSGPGLPGNVNWSNRAMFLAATPKQNQAPTAAFDPTCTGLYCSFDAGASNDPDGSIVNYAWTFGDGGTASGTSTTASHTYANGNTYTVTLTVTDNQGATDSVSHDVTVSVPTSNIGYVGGAAAPGGNVKTKTVTIPPSATVGNTALLFWTSNTADSWSGPTGVTGWTTVGTYTNSTLVTTVYSKTLAASDPGSQVSFSSSGYHHAALEVAVYSGVSQTNPVGPFAQALDTNSASHTTPAAQSGAGDWVVSFWADRSTATRTYTLPSGVVSRASSTDSGTLTDQAEVADSGAPVAGPAGNLTATTDAATNRSIAWTLILNNQ